MARPDLAKKFNIKSIWEPYIQEREGQAYFEPRTAWPAPTYEHWWPYPFLAPEVPGLGPPGAERPTINPGMVQMAEGPAGLAGSAPTTMPNPDFAEGGFGGTEALPAIAGTIAAGAAGAGGQERGATPSLGGALASGALEASAGALAGSGSAAQGAVGPALGQAGAGLGGAAVSLIPTLLAGITNILLDPGRGFLGFGANPTRNIHKTQTLHDIEEGMSHSAFAQTLPRVSSRADMANVFNQIAQGSASVPGGYLEPEELQSPSVIDTMLKGSLFQGENAYNFLKTLQHIDPSNPYFGIHPMRATPAPIGEPSGYTPGMSKSDIALRLGRPETQEEEERRTAGYGWAPWNP